MAVTLDLAVFEEAMDMDEQATDARAVQQEDPEDVQNLKARITELEQLDERLERIEAQQKRIEQLLREARPSDQSA